MDSTILSQFLSLVTDDSHPQYGRSYLNKILQPSLALEASIRDSFQNPGTRQNINALPTDLYMGLFDAFSLPISVRVVHARPENAPLDSRPIASRRPERAGDHQHQRHFTFYSEAAHVICSFPRHDMFPLCRALYRENGTRCMVDNLSSFQENLRIFTHGALADISDWDNMVITGGSVVASLCGPPPRAEGGEWTALEINSFYQSEKLYRTSDIDIFLYALTAEQAIAKTEEICSAISKSTLWPITIIRKADRILIHRLYPCRTIHIYLKLYTSPAEILARCDIDCSSCLYDGYTVYMNPRALIALMCQSNTLDLRRWGPSYEIRLAKYAERGFEVHIPFLDREKVDYGRIYDRNLTHLPTGLGRLFVLELLQYMPDHLHALNNSELSLKQVAPKHLENPSLYAPVDKRLAQDDDVLWSKVPYGPHWDATALHTLVGNINTELNKARNSPKGRKLHRHPICSFTRLSDCLKGVCDTCPEPSTNTERDIVHAEREIYCRGPLRFFPPGDVTGEKDDPSFCLGESDSERVSKFIGDTYRRAETLGDGDPILAVIPRAFWNRCVIGEGTGMQPKLRQKFETYTKSEGAAPTVVSLFRFYAEVDRFISRCTSNGLQEDRAGTAGHSSLTSQLEDSSYLMDTEDDSVCQSSRDSDSDSITGLDAGLVLHQFSNRRHPLFR